MKNTLRRHLYTAIRTFLSSFIVAFGALFQVAAQGEITGAILTSLLFSAGITALNALLKYLNETFIKP